MDSHEIGKRNRGSFEKGFLYQIKGEESKYGNEQLRIQRAIEKFENLLEQTPYATPKMISKVRDKVSELKGRQEAFRRGMEAGTFNPEGDIDQEYNNYIMQLEQEQKDAVAKKDDDQFTH